MNRVCAGFGCIAALAMGAACYRPEPAEGLPCSPERGDCPDGQECGSDNICRLIGAEVPIIDAAFCPVTTCEVEVLSSGAGSATMVSAVHPDYVFWTSTGDRRVFRTSKVGPQTNTVDQGAAPYAPLGLATDATSVYWSDSRTSGAIFGRSATGAGSPTTIVSGQDFPLYVAIDASHVYWTNAGGLVLRATKVGGGLTMVAASPADGTAGALVLDDTRVYFAHQSEGGGNVYSIAKDGSGDLTTVSANQDAPLSVGVDAEYVYWTNSEGGEVKRRSHAGGDVEVVAMGQPGVSFLAVGPRHVYWTNRDGGQVMRVDKTTLAVDALAVEQASPYGIALDGDALYWVNQGGQDRLMRIYPCACQ